MADKYSPEIIWAKDAATRFNNDEAVLIMLDELTGLIGVYSYGKTGKKCGHAKRVADIAHTAIIKAYNDGVL